MDDTLKISLETIDMGKQAIVFVSSRASAEKTAEDLSKLVTLDDPYLLELESKISKVVSPPTKQCRRLAKCIKRGIAFHHSGLANKQKELIEDEFRAGKVKVICATPTLAAGLSLPAFRVILKSLKRYSGKWGMDWIPVLEYLQMAGRAGRPEYEKFGEAICIVKNEKEKDEIYERYIQGEPEEIYSKLAVEPVLRTYVLSLIASGIIRNQIELKEFFAKTFWAEQFQDLAKLEEIMDRMLDLLLEWKFVRYAEKKDSLRLEDKEIEHEDTNESEDSKEIKENDVGFTSAINMLAKYKKELKSKEKKKEVKKSNENKRLQATLIGKRVSQLYLDPLTAKQLIDCLEKANKNGGSDFSYLQIITYTLEMRPRLSIRKQDQEFVEDALVQNYENLLCDEPDTYDIDYPEFMKSIKTAMFMLSWINEKSEDFLLERYNIRPGEIRAKVEISDWLIYACYEISDILGYKEVSKDLRKLRVRVKNGAKEELLVLLKLRGVGRRRARKLYFNGIKGISDLKKVDVSTLSQLLGPKLTVDVKKQVGIEVEQVPAGRRKGQLGLGKY